MRHGYLGYRVSGPLYIHVSRHRLGELFTSDTQFTLARNPATVVRPDVAFIRGDRMPRPEEHDRISRIAPDAGRARQDRALPGGGGAAGVAGRSGGPDGGRV